MKLLQKIKTWLNSDNNLLFASVTTLLLLGLVVIYFVGPYESVRFHQNANFLFNRYFPAVIAGVLAFIVCSNLSKKWLLRLSWVIGVLGILMMILNIVSPIYTMGAARYVRILGVMIDPFFMTLPAYIVLMSHWLNSDKANKKLVSCVATITSLFIMVAALRAPYVFMAMVYLIVFGVLSYRARKNMPYAFYSFATIMTAFMLAMIFALFKLPHIHNRFVVAMNWMNYPTKMSLSAIKSSALIGSTPESVQALSRMVMPTTDFAFAGILAKFGILFGIMIVALYGIIAKTLLNISNKTKDMLNKNVSICTCIIFGFMTLLGILCSFGFVYMSSHLPFVSLGITKLLFWCILFGFVISANKK